MDRNFIRIYTKRDGLVPHYANPQMAVPISRDDHFIKKKYVHERKQNMKLVYTTSSSTSNQPPLTVRLESARGKTQTAIGLFVISSDKVEALAKKLKSKCACGGSVREGAIYLQGDLREKVKKVLVEEGFQVK